MNTYVWLIRREFWENRAIWICPAVIACALMLAALFGRVEVAGLGSPERNRAMAGMVLFAFGIIFFLVMTIYSSWYLLDCLNADRKDRSILFWKSLPISDTAMVLAKLFTGLIAIPIGVFRGRRSIGLADGVHHLIAGPFVPGQRALAAGPVAAAAGAMAVCDRYQSPFGTCPWPAGSC